MFAKHLFIILVCIRMALVLRFFKKKTALTSGLLKLFEVVLV